MASWQPCNKIGELLRMDMIRNANPVATALQRSYSNSRSRGFGNWHRIGTGAQNNTGGARVE